jgi:hypothetical protein
MARMRELGIFLWAQTKPAIQYFTLKNPDPDPSFVWFILNAFFFVGVVLSIAFGIGLAFGGFRFWLLEKFPNNWLNGSDKDDPTKTFRLTD